MSSKSLLIRNGQVANAAGGCAGRLDVLIEDGIIARTEQELDPASAETVIDANGLVVMPGLVDSHVHVSGHFGSPVGFRMLVSAGVTACLDLAGDASQLRSGLIERGYGMWAGVLVPVIPGVNVTTTAPSRATLSDLLERELARGALGLKLLGGHYPLAPESIAEAIGLCSDLRVYCAVHAGSTAAASDIRGLEEVKELAREHRVHVAHINSYCRGQIDEPVAEAARAIGCLAAMPGAISESYLARINAAEATCRNGQPVSHIVRRCLQVRGYDVSVAGLEQAIRDGWAQIQVDCGWDIELRTGEAGLRAFRERETQIGVCFEVNSAASSLAVALARDQGGYVVDALATDGGSIPRNVTLDVGMRLVSAGFLSLPDLIEKASFAPARMLGLTGKGRLEQGSDGDVICVDSVGTVHNVVIGGRLVIHQRQIIGAPSGGGLICSAAAELPGGNGGEVVQRVSHFD